MLTKDNKTILNEIVRFAEFQDALPEWEDSIRYKTPDGRMSPIGYILFKAGRYDKSLEGLSADDDKIKAILDDLGYDHEFLSKVEKIVTSSEILESWMGDLKTFADEKGITIESGE